MVQGKLPPPAPLLPLCLPLTIQLRHIDLDLGNELPLTFKPMALVYTTSGTESSNNYVHIITRETILMTIVNIFNFIIFWYLRLCS